MGEKIFVLTELTEGIDVPQTMIFSGKIDAVYFAKKRIIDKFDEIHRFDVGFQEEDNDRNLNGLLDGLEDGLMTYGYYDDKNGTRYALTENEI